MALTRVMRKLSLAATLELTQTLIRTPTLLLSVKPISNSSPTDSNSGRLRQRNFPDFYTSIVVNYGNAILLALNIILRFCPNAVSP